jgi:AcrR family transcriptional regulator
MGTLERREREKAELRQKILDAAREMFVAEGPDAVTMRKIAARIEYSATAIYAYFPDKEALLRALCDHDFAQFLNAGMHLMQEPDPVKRTLLATRFYIDFALEHPHQYQFMFMMPSDMQPSDPALVMYSLMRDTVTQIDAAGGFRADIQDADVIAQTFWATLHGAVSLHIAGRCKYQQARPVREVAETAVAALMRGFLREEVAVGLPAFGTSAPPKRRAGRRASKA